jgi:hypothetical protein
MSQKHCTIKARLTPAQHEDLHQRAEKELVSLNQYIVYLLSCAVSKPFRRRRDTSTQGFDDLFIETRQET